MHTARPSGSGLQPDSDSGLGRHALSQPIGSINSPSQPVDMDREPAGVARCPVHQWPSTVRRNTRTGPDSRHRILQIAAPSRVRGTGLHPSGTVWPGPVGADAVPKPAGRFAIPSVALAKNCRPLLVTALAPPRVISSVREIHQWKGNPATTPPDEGPPAAAGRPPRGSGLVPTS